MVWYGFKSHTPKNNLFFLFFWDLDGSYLFKKRTTCVLVFPFQNQKNWGKQTKHIFWVKTKHSLKSFFLFCSIFLFLWFFYWFTWLPSVSLCLLTLSVLGSQILIKLCHSSACALCETKPGVGCAVMFMHLKISCCSALCSISSNSWNLGFVHTHSCLCLTYSNNVYKYLETDTFGYFGGNGGVFLWEHVTLLCNRML